MGRQKSLNLRSSKLCSIGPEDKLFEFEFKELEMNRNGKSR